MRLLDDTDKMPFGKHKGELMQEVPVNYLHYLWHNGLKEEATTSNVAEYIKRNLAGLKIENKDLIWS